MAEKQIDWELDKHRVDAEIASGLDDEDLEAAADYFDDLMKNGYPEEGTGLFPVRYLK